MGKKDTKRKGNCAFTLVELIAVVTILSILLCIAVPNMMNYISAAHGATTQTETRICMDAVQCYLSGEKEKSKPTGGMLLRLMGLDLSNSDGSLEDYISGGQKGARIVSVEADLTTGRLQVLKYENRYCIMKLNADGDGNITKTSDQERGCKTRLIWGIVLTVWGWLLDHLLYISLALSIIIILFQRRDPRSVQAQLLALYFIPVLGVVFYLLFGQDMEKSRMFRVEEVSDRLDLPIKSQENIICSDDMLGEMMDPVSRDFKGPIVYNLETSGSVFTVNNQVQIYTNGQAKFEALRNALRQTYGFIRIQYYIIRNDKLFDSIVPVPLDKMREGMEVRILCGGMGGHFIPEKRWDQMRSAGTKVGAFLPPFLGWLSPRVNYRNHRKVVVVDGNAGSVGGPSIGREYISRDPKFGYWRNIHLEIRGGVAISLQIHFTLDWNYVTGENLFKGIHRFEEKVEYVRHQLNGQIRAMWPDPDHVSEMVCMRIITSEPDTREPHMRNNYLGLFHRAKHHIYIQTPYFIPDDAISSSLRIAALSSVDVRLMVLCKLDHPFVYRATCSYAGELLDYGARVYAYENEFPHFKDVMIDGRVNCCGTVNVDIRSLELNSEANATIYDEEVTGQPEEAFMNDLPHCQEVTREEYTDRNLRMRVKEQSSHLLSPPLQRIPGGAETLRRENPRSLVNPYPGDTESSGKTAVCEQRAAAQAYTNDYKSADRTNQLRR